MGERGTPQAGHGADPAAARPTPAQRAYLRRGLSQPGGKLPLFDHEGQRVDPKTIHACLRHGWAEPWFANPMKPDWLVCRLTPAGRHAAADADANAPTDPPA
jgi:hypothetical protein